MEIKKVFRYAVVIAIVIGAALVLSSLVGCRTQVSDQPPREFKEKCEAKKAFRIYLDHENKWACKLDDGRVFTE